MTGYGDAERPPSPPASWQDWQRWVEGVDWSDWRSWLQRVAVIDWAAGPWPNIPWEGKPQEREAIPLTVRAFGEDEPGQQMAAQPPAAWPTFRRWWHEGANARPGIDEARTRLEQHMPELVPRWATADRHARLPMGTAGRDQRRRAGRLTDLRGTAAGRRGLRYPAGDPLVLQVCGTVEEAVRALRRFPVHMSFKVIALDRGGSRAR